MSGYVLAPEAEEDIFEIWRYLANEASVAFAGQVESELFDDFELLARAPGLGHKRTDLTQRSVLLSGVPVSVHDHLRQQARWKSSAFCMRNGISRSS